MSRSPSRRSFLQAAGLGSAALGLSAPALAQQKQKPIQGFEEAPPDPNAAKGWQSVSDRKIGSRNRSVSDALRYCPMARPVLAADEARRLGIASHLFRLRVEVHHAADTRGNVGQVAQCRR